MNIGEILNRQNLKTARENAGFSSARATKKVSQTESDLVSAWENGQSSPTWSQLEKLAKAYNIPTLLFFSNEPIKQVRQIADFRSFTGVVEVDDTDVKQLINLVVSRQKWISAKLNESGHPKNVLLGSGSKISTPRELAIYIGNKLDFSVDEIKEISGNTTDSKRKALNKLIGKAEAKGIFVGKTLAQHKITVDQMRGLFIADDLCPFIVLNRKDSVSAQIFTLAHELAHFFRRTEGISNSVDFRDTQKNKNPEEIFCNRVAAELLLPANDFQKSHYTKQEIAELSSVYKLSRIFIFYRLKDLGLIRRYEVSGIEKEILEETRNGVVEKESRKAEGGNYTNNMKDSNGSLFNKVIASAYFENRIGYVEAAKLLRFSPESV